MTFRNSIYCKYFATARVLLEDSLALPSVRLLRLAKRGKITVKAEFPVSDFSLFSTKIK